MQWGLICPGLSSGCDRGDYRVCQAAPLGGILHLPSPFQIDSTDSSTDLMDHWVGETLDEA